MRGIVHDCIVELLSRRVIYVFAALTVIGLLSTLAASQVDIAWQGAELDMSDVNSSLGNIFLGGFNKFMSFLVFLSVMITAGQIPGMLIRGRADYYLSKPISRASLLMSKALGIWLVYGAVMVVSVAINYVFACLLFGIYDARIVYVIAMNLLGFVIWLSVTTFAGIVTGSTGMTIMAAFFVWIAQSVLDWHEGIGQLVDSDVVRYIVDAFYYIIPKTGQIIDMTGDLTSGNSPDWLPLWSSLIFAAVIFYLAVYIFKRKDY
ncbi:MAG: ABC transporter permease [candidate division Zixibacteria bacterium]|nr:ABC transporter permease [candidate division Zixibacteria bacterium]MBU1470443.1 ABC transporter permease [candidate division Zixibacteria bacterium]MBU2625892.1 ABC transporter permease [candidate division Zixibacteria bacterium]